VPRTKRRWILLAALLAATCRGAGPGSTPSPAASGVDGLPNPLPEIAARVNGQAVYSLSVASRARELMRRKTVPQDQKAVAFQQALEELIAREALLQEATARRISADEAAVELAYDEARVLYKDDDAYWAKRLAEQGLDPQSFRAELRAKYTIEALQRVEADKVKPVSDEEARAFYDANPSLFDQVEPVRVRQIFIAKRSNLPEAWANERNKASAIRERIRRGDDFAALARELSEDPASKEKGGDLGAFVRGQMLKPFEDAVYALKAGEVSEVIETPIGYHVAKLEQRLPPRKIPFEEAKETIRSELLREKRDRAVRELNDAVKAKARVERFV